MPEQGKREEVAKPKEVLPIQENQAAIESLLKECDINGDISRYLPKLLELGANPAHLLSRVVADEWKANIPKNLELLLAAGLQLESFDVITLSAIRDSFIFDGYDALRQHRFGLAAIAAQADLAGGFPVFLDLMSEADLKKTHASLIQDGRVANARNLRAYAGLAGIDMSHEDTSPKVDHSKPDIDVVVFIESKESRQAIAPHEKMLQFYIDDAILYSLSKLAEKPDFASRVSFKNRLRYESLKIRAERSTKDLVTWLKVVLVRIIADELSNQPIHGLFVKAIPDTLCVQSVEDVLDYLDAASGIFHSTNWEDKYGGQPWSKIAAATYGLWNVNEPSRGQIDSVIHLEHNTGALFEKVPSHTYQVAPAVRLVLDAKANASRAEDILAALPDDVLSESLRNSLSSDLQEARSLEMAL